MSQKKAKKKRPGEATLIKQHKRRLAGKAGRPVGSTNKSTRVLQDILSLRAEGQLPHELLLDVSRGKAIPHTFRTLIPVIDATTRQPVLDKETGQQCMVERITEGFYYPSMAERLACAHDGAPYFAPRLSQLNIVQASDDESLEGLIERFASEVGVSIAFVGEGETLKVEIRSRPEASGGDDSAPTARNRVSALIDHGTGKQVP